jgi:hypothetical protein
MSQELQKLRLSEVDATVELGYTTYKQRDGIVRDLQTIHDPHKTRLQRWRERYLSLEDVVLSARPQDGARAMFETTVTIPFAESARLRVSVERLSDSSQAAGWTALQFYHELSEGESGIQQLHAIDPLVGIAAKAMHRDNSDIIGAALWTHETGLPPSVDPVPKKEVIFQNPLAAYEETGTKVTVFNDNSRSLPGLLHVLKAEYDYFYPGANTSEAVAGIVGARGVEEFSDAWEAAIPQGAVGGARRLLESGVFLFEVTGQA